MLVFLFFFPHINNIVVLIVLLSFRGCVFFFFFCILTSTSHMSRTPSTSHTEPQPSALSSKHRRSLSQQQSSLTLPSTTVTVKASSTGALRGGRPVAGATTVQKRRFRTQSSTIDSASRRAKHSTADATSGDGHAVAVHTRPSASQKADKVMSNGVWESKATNGGASKTKSSENAGTGGVLPKINAVTFQANVARTLGVGDVGTGRSDASGKTTNTPRANNAEVPQDMSASTPIATSSAPCSHGVVMKQIQSSSCRTAPATTCSVKDTSAATPAASAGDAAHLSKDSPLPTPPPPNTRHTSVTSFSLHVDDSAVLASGKGKASPQSPRDLPSVSRRESVASPSAPPAQALSSSSSASRPVKDAENATPASSASLRGSTHVNGGNNNVHASDERCAGGTQSNKSILESTTPPLSHRGSAVAAPTSSHRSAHAPFNVENAAAVTLPRVSSQGASGTPVQGRADSTVGDGTQPLKQSGSTRPPTTNDRVVAAPTVAPLQSEQATPPAVSSHTTNAAKEQSEKQSRGHLPPSQDASQLEREKPSSSKAAKAGHSVLLPAIVGLFSSPVSLRNFGATCYLNSVVQCLLNTPGLLRALDKDRQRIIKEWEDKKGNQFDEAHRRSCAERNAPATSALLDLGTARPKQHTPSPQLLLSLKAACGECNEEFAGNGQNDAHEFLITLLGVIDKEVCRSKPEAYHEMKDVENECKRDAYARWTERLRRENDSTIYDYFGGVTGSTVQCATCGLISYRFEALLDISLPMAYNSGPRAAATVRSGTNEDKNGKPRPEEVVAVDLLLNDMFFSDRGEFLCGAMQVTCDRCKKLRDKTIWSTVEQWPPILVLHLKRFNNAGIKNESAVVFPYTFCPFGRVKYHLYGVCCHRGTASCGHYTSYVYADGDASTIEVTRHSSALRDGRGGGHGDEVDAFRSPPSGSFARDADGDLGVGDECDLPTGKNVTQAKTHGGGSSNSANGDKSGGSSSCSRPVGKWYYCNDESITLVTASEVVSKTREAYILFYRRVA